MRRFSIAVVASMLLGVSAAVAIATDKTEPETISATRRVSITEGLSRISDSQVDEVIRDAALRALRQLDADRRYSDADLAQCIRTETAKADFGQRSAVV